MSDSSLKEEPTALGLDVLEKATTKAKSSMQDAMRNLLAKKLK
jgi:hypothetical protein